MGDKKNTFYSISKDINVSFGIILHKEIVCQRSALIKKFLSEYIKSYIAIRFVLIDKYCVIR